MKENHLNIYIYIYIYIPKLRRQHINGRVAVYMRPGAWESEKRNEPSLGL